MNGGLKIEGLPKTTPAEMRDLLGLLSERERRVVEARVLQKKTLQTVADTLGVTRERVRQIENGALAKMRAGATERPHYKINPAFITQAQRRERTRRLAAKLQRGIRWASRVKTGHILIARPDKAALAQSRLQQMGIDAMTMLAITLPSLSVGLAQAGYARFAGGTTERTPAQQGAALSHLGALQMGRALKWEWLGLWEEDVCGAGVSLQGRAQSNDAGFSDGPGFQTPQLSRARGLRVGDFWDALEIPPDCGAVYLGGALWGSADCYGEELGGGLWRARALPISCTHALMIHAQAMDDVIASCARMDMTIDDCVSRACIEATQRGAWTTCFVQPWIAWQVDRPETWPRELIEVDRS